MEPISGQMNCEVQSNSVVQMVEGKTSTFAGFEDGFIFGDMLVLSYQFVEIGRIGDAVISDFVIRLSGETHEDIYAFASLNSVTTDVSEKPDGLSLVESIGDSISLVQDQIVIKTFFLDWRMKRYYRSDWQSMATGFFWDDIHTFTMDCRTVGEDRLEEAIEAFRSTLGAWADK